MEELWNSIIAFFQTTGITIAKALAVVILGILFIKIIMKLLRKIYLKSSMENSIGSFILSLINVGAYIGLFFGVCSIINISTAGIIATLSTIILAIALSLQESLKNIASGLIIVATKPFKEGDLVDVSAVQGKILEIRMFSTKLVTFDNKIITVPNSQIVNTNVVNYSANSTRRIEISFGVAYGSDIKYVKQVISNVIDKHSKIFKTPTPIVRLAEHASSQLTIHCRVWVLTEDYFDVFYDLNEQVLEAFIKCGIEIPFNQMDVHVMQGEKVKIKEVSNGVDKKARNSDNTKKTEKTTIKMDLKESQVKKTSNNQIEKKRISK